MKFLFIFCFLKVMDMLITLLLFILIVYFIVKLTNRKTETYVGERRVANEIDDKRAVKFALENMCKNRGYRWVQGADEFVYDCKHTKETCEAESVYPSPPDTVFKYYEWRTPSHEEFYETGEALLDAGTGSLLSSSAGQSSGSQRVDDKSKIDGVCIIGNEPFRKFCEDEDLRYDKSNGKCYTTKPYCNKRLLAFCGDDCFETPTSLVLGKVFGTTIGRSVGYLSYLDQIVKYTC